MSFFLTPHSSPVSPSLSLGEIRLLRSFQVPVLLISVGSAWLFILHRISSMKSKFHTNMAEGPGALLLGEIRCLVQECDPATERNPPCCSLTSTWSFQSICSRRPCVLVVKWRASFNMLELLSCCSLRYHWCVHSKESSSELHFFLPLLQFLLS